MRGYYEHHESTLYFLKNKETYHEILSVPIVTFNKCVTVVVIYTCLYTTGGAWHEILFFGDTTPDAIS